MQLDLAKWIFVGFVGLSRLAASADTCAADAAAVAPLERVADIDLPGPPTRFDYQSYDPRLHRLFIAHLGAGTVIAFDTRSNQVIGEIPQISQVHGVLGVPGLGKIYASATGTHEIVVIDAQTMKEIARVPGGAYPDGIAYAPEVQKLYVSDEMGRAETVIDTRTNTRLKTISLGGEVGNSQYDPVTRHVWVNVQTLGQMIEIDPRTDSVVGRLPLPGASRNHGLLIDPVEHIAYVSCEGNAKLLVVDLDTKKVLSIDSVGDDPDVLAFDETPRLLYVASESGVVSVFQREGKTLRKIGEGLLAKRAHSVAVDPETHRVYFPLEDLNGRPVLRIMEPKQ
jgi:YVTN family beta-propeller protein